MVELFKNFKLILYLLLLPTCAPETKDCVIAAWLNRSSNGHFVVIAHLSIIIKRSVGVSLFSLCKQLEVNSSVKM